MSDFRIRGAAKGDVAALAHLMSDLGYPTSPGEMRHRLEDISADPSYCALVAERDGRVLGMVGLHIERVHKQPWGDASPSVI
jgi:N-acetylglutamate synthase-like GNAT family acetyltransferase